MSSQNGFQLSPLEGLKYLCEPGYSSNANVDRANPPHSSPQQEVVPELNNRCTHSLSQIRPDNMTERAVSIPRMHENENSTTLQIGESPFPSFDESITMKEVLEGEKTVPSAKEIETIKTIKPNNEDQQFLS